MSTQYDDIGGRYEDTKRAPGARLEEHNLHLALKPYVQGATVLDLACGTGYYSRKLVQWGARSITAVDISQKMIDFAEESLTSVERQRITFKVADCAIPTSHTGGPFDIVLGSWLLNYAADAAELTQMYRNISGNLKPGGVFVGVCPQPSNDLHEHFRNLEAKPKAKFGFDAYIKNDVQDGVRVHVTVYPPNSPPVEFENYQLKKEVFEKGARDGGLSGFLEWPSLDIPVMKDLGQDYWEDCAKYLPFAILKISA